MSTESGPLVDFRRLATRAGIGVLALGDLGILYEGARAPLSNPDTYFHLRFGDEFLHRWSIAHPGQPGTTSSAPWVPTQWLSEMVWAWVEQHAGAAGLSVLYAGLMVAFVSATYVAARSVATPVPAFVAASGVFIGTLHWSGLRPQLVSYILLALVVGAWQRARDRGSTPWWLIPLTWVWAMCHGMWIIGIAIGFVAALAIGWEERDGPRLRRCLAVPLISLVAAALTPVGPRLLIAVVQVGSRARHFAEWAPTPLLNGWGIPITIMVGAVIVLRVRRGNSSPFTVLMTLLAVGFAIYSGRTVVASLLVVGPLLAAEIENGKQGLGKGKGVTRIGAKETFAVAAVVIAGLAVGGLASANRQPPLADNLTAFSATLDQLPRGTTVITDRNYGSVMLEAYPDLDIPIQGYGDVFTSSELDRYDAISRLSPGWVATLRQIDACHALLEPGSALAYALSEHRWTIAVRSKNLVFLVAPPSSCESLAR